MPDDYTYRAYTCKGKVIGEFICDFYETITFSNSKDKIGFEDCVSEYLTNDACLTKRQVFEYSNGKPLYSWHISDLVIYDKPKELCDFMPSCKYLKDGGSYQWEKIDCDCQKTNFNPDYSVNSVLCLNQMTRPPQSWCYCEEC